MRCCCIRQYPSGVLCSVLGEAHFDMHAHIKDASTNRSYVHVNCESNVISLHVEAHRVFDARIRVCKGRILGAHCIAEILHLNKILTKKKSFIAAVRLSDTVS